MERAGIPIQIAIAGTIGVTVIAATGARIVAGTGAETIVAGTMTAAAIVIAITTASYSKSVPDASAWHLAV